MIKSKKLLLLTMILVCTCSLGISAEPNEVLIEWSFKSGNKQLSKSHHKPITLPEGTSYYAVLFVRGDWRNFRDAPIDEIMNNPVVKRMSQKQRDIISNQVVRFKDYNSTISGYTYFQLYGVSEDDVQKMTKALLEIIENRIENNIQNMIRQKNECQEIITETQKQLAEKQEQYKKVAKYLENVKNNTHYLSPEEAQKTVEKLNTTIDELNIEIAGMNIKLKAIDGEHRAAKETMKSFEQQEIYKNTIWPKLEVMRIDQIIDLRVAEKKRSTASSIRQEAEQFYKLHKQDLQLQIDIRYLTDRLSDRQRDFDNIDRRLSTEPELQQPLKVFQNKITIYPL